MTNGPPDGGPFGYVVEVDQAATHRAKTRQSAKQHKTCGGGGTSAVSMHCGQEKAPSRR